MNSAPAPAPMSPALLFGEFPPSSVDVNRGLDPQSLEKASKKDCFPVSDRLRKADRYPQEFHKYSDSFQEPIGVPCDAGRPTEALQIAS